MAGVPERAGVRALAILLLALAGCGGSKVLEEPRTLTLEAPLATGIDERIELHLDWVIVPNGPGSWVRHAEWDQYLLRIGNVSTKGVRITRAVLYDAQDVPVEPSAVAPTLIRATRETSRRYRDAGLRVRAGVGGKGMLAAGYVAGTAGYGLGMAVLYGSAAPAASGLAIGAMGAGAVLVVGGVIQSYQEDRIAREMIKRHTPLPYDIDPGVQQIVNWFFPLTPSPRRLEVHYVDRSGEHKLVLDTRDPLDGLHLGDPLEQEQP